MKLRLHSRANEPARNDSPASVRTLIFGHSHVWSIQRAIASGAYTPTLAGLTQQVILCGTKKFPSSLVLTAPSGAKHLNAALASALADHPSSDDKTWLVSAVQNNYYNILGMLNNGQPFDFVAPGLEKLGIDPEADIIPYAAIRESLAKLMDELPIFFRKLNQMGYSGLFHIGAPPPNPSSDVIHDQLSNEPKFESIEPNITLKWVRLKLWAVQDDIMNELCSSAGVHYLSAPAECRDSDGFLQQKLCKDAVHGNAAYAALVLRQIEKTLSTIHLER